MARRLAAFLKFSSLACFLALAPQMAAAQLPGLTGAQSETAEQEGGQSGESVAQEPATPDSLRALAEALQDPAAREALIDELLRAAEAGPSEDTDGAASDAAPDQAEVPPAAPAPGLAREIAELTTGIAEEAVMLGRRLGAAFAGLTSVATGERAVDWPRLGDTLSQLAIVAGATLLAWWLVGRLARGVFEAAARKAVGRGWAGRLLLLLGTGIVDAVVILLAWGGGYALALTLGEGGRVGITQGLFLNAFLAIELVKLGLRLVLAPRHGELRLLPIPERSAAYWYFWLARLTGLLGYGFMLVVPVANANLSWAAGRGLRVLIALTATLIAVVLILANRRAVRFGLEAQARGLRGEITATALHLFAKLWHLLALFYVLALFAIWLARPFDALDFMLGATGESLTAVALGLVAVAGLTRLISGGVRLPDSLRRGLPLLEGRLNAFVPNLLKGVRLLVLLAVLLAIAEAWSLLAVGDWLASETGTALFGSLIGALAVLSVALLLWVAVVSWIEYRMNPDVGRVTTARSRTLLALFRNAFTVTLLVVAVMLALSELGVNIGPLLAGAGVVGLAIGFGAQKLVQDIITGAFIQFENAMNEGEVVTVAGTTGVVERLTVRSVGLRDLSGVYHLIPFSSVDSVSNFMKGFSYHLAEIGVAYREDIAEVKRAMHDAFDELKASEQHGPEILEPFEMHGVTQFGDSAVVVRGRIKTRPGSQWAVGRAYNEIVKRLFDARGIEIPFPHLTLYMGQDKDGSAPPLHLKAAEIEALTQRAKAQAGETEASTGAASEPTAPRLPKNEADPDGSKQDGPA